LERGSQLHRVFAGLRIPVPEDPNRDQADSGGDSIAVNGEIIESPVASSPKVHFKTQDQVVKVLPGNRVAVNAVGKGSKFGLGILRESRKARANLRPLRLRIETIQRVAVKRELARGSLGRQPPVGNVVGAPRKRVHRLKSLAFVSGQEEEGIVEV